MEPNVVWLEIDMTSTQTVVGSRTGSAREPQPAARERAKRDPFFELGSVLLTPTNDRSERLLRGV